MPPAAALSAAPPFTSACTFPLLLPPLRLFFDYPFFDTSRKKEGL